MHGIDVGLLGQDYMIGPDKVHERSAASHTAMTSRCAGTRPDEVFYRNVRPLLEWRGTNASAVAAPSVYT